MVRSMLNASNARASDGDDQRDTMHLHISRQMGRQTAHLPGRMNLWSQILSSCALTQRHGRMRAITRVPARAGTGRARVWLAGTRPTTNHNRRVVCRCLDLISAESLAFQFFIELR
jgi:hypothetical protein